jgi:hypothetical protein
MAQSLHSLSTLALCIATAALLGGCPSPAQRPSPPGSLPGARSGDAPPSIPPPPGAPAPRSPPPPRANRLSPATLSLVTQARALLAHGDFNGASSTLDRALRIEPNNPLLWIEQGRERLVESEPRQAEGCGRKALALASGDHAAQKQAGRLLADSLRAQQRNQEAQELESQPFMK